MWLIAQASEDGNLAALTALVTAIGGIVLGLFTAWRSYRSDQRGEVDQLREENKELRQELRRELAGFRRDLGRVWRKFEQCEADKADMARQLAELGGGPP